MKMEVLYAAMLLLWATDADSRLILTPFIETGKIPEGRNLSAVHGGPFPANVTSHSGFLTVNKTCNSNLFFWFFLAEKNWKEAPVLLWLQGGPGTSSLFGLFNGVGPFTLSEDGELLRNAYSWHKKFSVLFIDNPVGTGFSFADSEECFTVDQRQVGNELYSAIVQFFRLFPELQHLPFFIAGESYAGKYVPALAYTIHSNNKAAKVLINLQGLAVGNALTDPAIAFESSHFAFQVGLIDSKTYDAIKEQEETGKRLIKSEKFLEAFNVWEQIYRVLLARSDFDDLYNILEASDWAHAHEYSAFADREVVRKGLHVGNTTFKSIKDVYDKWKPFLMQSALPWLEAVVGHYRTLFYSGQLDCLVPYSSSVSMYNRMNFSAAEEYRNAKRVPWYVDEELAGYMKSAGKFTEVLVRNAGHMVPADQPKWAFDLITLFATDDLPKDEYK